MRMFRPTNIDDKRIAQISKIAFLYYKENKNQQEISDIMSIAIPTVSKILSEAKKLSLIDFNVKYPWRCKDIENSIIKDYGIDNAIIVEISNDSYKILLKELGIATANFLSLF